MTVSVKLGATPLQPHTELCLTEYIWRSGIIFFQSLNSATSEKSKSQGHHSSFSILFSPALSGQSFSSDLPHTQFKGIIINMCGHSEHKPLHLKFLLYLRHVQAHLAPLEPYDINQLEAPKRTTCCVHSPMIHSWEKSKLDMCWCLAQNSIWAFPPHHSQITISKNVSSSRP